MLELKWRPANLGRSLKRASDAVEPSIKKRLKVVGRALVKEVSLNLSGRVLHRRSGKLWRSWQRPEISNTPRGYRLLLGSDVAYARIHELGGRTGRDQATRLPARPYAWRAVQRSRTLILRELGAALKEVARKAG